jgi:hypothetical protein
MATTHCPRTIEGNQSKNFDDGDVILLERVAERLVWYGQQVGVTADEMISLLDSGISIHDLLAFLASKSSGAA